MALVANAHVVAALAPESAQCSDAEPAMALVAVRIRSLPRPRWVHCDLQRKWAHCEYSRFDRQPAVAAVAAAAAAVVVVAEAEAVTYAAAQMVVHIVVRETLRFVAVYHAVAHN